MANSTYMAGRIKYQRPEAMLWSLNSGSNSSGVWYPTGTEIGAGGSDFLTISDHNRAPIDFKTTRIEKRERMINGRMRSYHIADKLTISTSWSMLPSRAFSLDPKFDTSTGLPTVVGITTGGSIINSGTLLGPTDIPISQYTVDGGAGGVDLLEWYENHTGSFWVFLAYDKHSNFSTNEYSHLKEYNQVIEMYITDFSYTVEKRGGRNMDLWNINVTLEEV
jgi:hypothetical protein